MKQPPTVFIVDTRTVVLRSLEVAVNAHGFPVRSFTSAADFIAEQHPDQVGCVLVDPLMSTDGGMVLRWLHESRSILSIVLISGLIDSSAMSQEGSSTPIAGKPHEISALLTMVTDGLAGSLSRKVIQERSRG